MDSNKDAFCSTFVGKGSLNLRLIDLVHLYGDFKKLIKRLPTVTLWFQ